MTIRIGGGPKRSGISARILIAGNDLLTGALANAFQKFGFSTMYLTPSAQEIERGIKWEPDLVLMDVRSFDLTAGSALISRVRRAGLRVCVIDSAGDSCRLAAWSQAGLSGLIDENESFDHVFGTITRLLRTDSRRQIRRGPASSLASTLADEFEDASLDLSLILTEREQVVLAELMEGHNAEEIAKAGYVSISTVRSQIKAILQKLGVKSQLAAVAIARRAGWSLESPIENSVRPTSSRPRRVS
jgi:two-component system, NarL family, nitrate/nitrite response regulator NarL